MPDSVIIVENLSKSYLIGHQFSSERRYKYTALRDVVGREFHRFARRTVDFVRGRQIVQGDEVDEFWALKDVSFEVRQGEVLGIIGRNGAGKSTLLKILSRITEPTRGRVILRGRIASLLEVGTGFHPELTGKENIFLNGAVLGMTHREVRKKLEEIVDFAGVERFLDTPVKYYSSGMYVRLAFAVAAHLEPDILVVDEVLAVGDVDFQRKCFGKLQDVVSKDGRTILLVSHNLAAIENLCNSVLLLAEGRKVAQGNTSVVLAEYLRDIERHRTIPLAERMDREGSGQVRFVSIALEDSHGCKVAAFRCGAEAIIHFVIENRTKQQIPRFQASFAIENEMGEPVALLSTKLRGFDIAGIPPGRKSMRVVIPKMPLVPGRYGIRIYSTLDGSVTDWIKHAGTFDVEAGDYYGTGALPERRWGSFLLDYRFTLNEAEPQL